MKAAKKPAKPRKRVLVTSDQINAFIAKHGSGEANFRTLAERIKRDLGVSMSRDTVRQRARNLDVVPLGVVIRPQGRSTFAQVQQDPLNKALAKLMLSTKSSLSVEQYADKLDVAPKRVHTAIDELKAQGHVIRIVAGSPEMAREIPKSEPFRFDIRKLRGKTIKFGLTADNHLGSKYQRLDILNALYDVWHADGIDTVYQCGNMIDGEARFNKSDLLAFGLEGQARYFAEHWPKRPGMKTFYVTGDDHEGWYVQRESVDVGRYLEDVARRQGRKDLIYLGHMEHDVIFAGREQNTVMRVIHAGGGSSYATSYSVQKIVESYQGGEKPHILLVGHYHKAEYGYPREVHVIQAGCTCDQTPFMRKNKLQAHLGGWTVEMTLNDLGVITAFKTTWMPFFNRDFYDKRWAYKDLRPAA